MRRLVILAASTALPLATPALAQSDRGHETTSRDIIVTAPFERARGDVLAGTSVVTGDVLTRDLRPAIGDTLARQPGVSATSFGPNASRPVLRGFQGERIRVLTDGIGSIDVSNTSVDHPVVINQLTADRIEVLRGPAALLFGSSAIGGVVNVIDSRIPRRLPDEAVHIEALATYGSAAEERSFGGVLDVPLGKFVLHVDGSYLKTDDLRTGGFILAPNRRAEALASGDAEIAELANLRDRLPNSGARTWEVAGGAAYIDEGGNIGFSVSRYDSLFGIPPRFSLEPGGETEFVRLDVKQTRVDVRAEIEPASGFISTIRFRGGFADYLHNEIEPDGAIGTTFINKGWEGRLELVQRARGGWQGAVGGQFAIRDLNAIGEEAFLPKSETNSFGLFTLQSLDAGRFKGEFGLRYEKTRVRADASATIGNDAISRSFDAFSGSIGGSVALVGDLRLGVSLSHTERAPSAEELYSNGPHLATQAFEIGDPTFRKETSNGVEVSLRATGDRFNFALNGYYTEFDNFIFDTDIGAIEDDLPVFQYFQADARYWGIEAEASLKLFEAAGFSVKGDFVGDYTRATIRGTGPAPRIPALRLLGGLEAQSRTLTLRGEVEWVDKQTRIAAFETPTDGYTLVNASIAWRPFGDRPDASLILSANNIFDVEARRHASILKDFAPLAGRDIRVSLRFAI